MCLAPKQSHAKREVICQGPISKGGKGGVYFQTEESMGTQTSVKHLRVGPRGGSVSKSRSQPPLQTAESWVSQKRGRGTAGQEQVAEASSH